MFSFFFKNWSLVDLQCWASFRCTERWFSYMYVYVYIVIYICMYVNILFQILFPRRLLQNIALPVLCSRSSLAVCFIYSSVYMLTPNSLIYPPPCFGNHVCFRCSALNFPDHLIYVFLPRMIKSFIFLNWPWKVES